MRVILSTYRSISWIVRPCAYLHAKYWGVPVTMLAEEDYSQGQFEFVQIPDDDKIHWDSKREVPAWHYADALIWYLRQIQDELVIIMMADYLITQPVNQPVLYYMEQFMHECPSTVRCQVGDDSGLHCGVKHGEYRGVEIWEGNFLPSSLTPGLWRRDFLLESTHPGDTPWWMELHGRDYLLEHPGLVSVAPKPGIMSYVNALRGQDTQHVVLTRALYEEIRHLVKVPVNEEELL